jgi:HEAT repeat protein
MSQHDLFIQKWIEYLNNATDSEMSRIAARKLGEAKDPVVVPDLIRALESRPDDVRLAAARALGEIGHRSAVKALIGLLHDSNHLVASSAADALGEIADSTAVPALVSILQDYKERSSRHFQIHGYNRGLYMAAVQALNRIGTPEALRAVATYHR